MGIISRCLNADGMLRSKPMQYYRLTMPRDIVRDIVHSLGQLDACHFVDLNINAQTPPGYDNSFLMENKKRIIDCAQFKHRLEAIENLVPTLHIQLPLPLLELDDSHFDGPRHTDVLSSLSAILEPLETSLYQNMQFKEEIEGQINAIKEQLCVFDMLSEIMIENNPELVQEINNAGEDDNYPDGGLTVPLLEQNAVSAGILRFVTGVIPLARINTFQRLLFRLSRGKCLFRSAPIEELLLNDNKQLVEKHVFCVYFIGDTMERKITKMCDGFGASIYVVPDNPHTVQQLQRHNQLQLQEKVQVLHVTERNLRDLLDGFVFKERGVSPLRYWQRELDIEIGIFDSMRKMVALKDYVNAHMWCPDDSSSRVAADVDRVSHILGHAQVGMWPQPTDDPPPTYFAINSFTSSFQGLVDTYGIPRYGEINPGLYTIFSFPFLVGVMFGDIGHASLLFFFSLWLLWMQKKHEEKAKIGKLGEILTMIHGGRYFLLLTSIFAIYCGFIYNDMFSISLNLFGGGVDRWTGFDPVYNRSYYLSETPYPFGIDPTWHGTSNQLDVYNSLKMKLAVIIGVIHMTFGLCLSCFNHIYRKDWATVILEWIPQMLFMLCLFGYMDFLIIYKWCIDWNPIMFKHIDVPNLIQNMLGMIPGMGQPPKYEIYPGQIKVQQLLVSLALISIPILFLARPFYLKFKHSRRLHQYYLLHHEPEGNRLLDDEGEDGFDAPALSQPPEFSFSNVFIHQAIHQIEYILGAISNTASYLRLWALSLAHAKLSEVFWSKLMVMTIDMGNPVFIVVGFACWVAATLAVLCTMDLLECFLHALRLHWVEFQNKFYMADGYAFAPFSFTDRLLETAQVAAAAQNSSK